VKMRKYVVTIGVVAALLVLVLVAAGCTSTAPVSAQQSYPSAQQTGIWVSGRGEIQAAPDVAVVDLGVQAQADSVAEAQSMASQAMQDVMAALKANSIDDKDIKTTGYNVWQQTRWDPDNQIEVVTGYQVSNSVEVKVRNVDTAGAVIDAVVQAGGDYIRVSGISFQVDDPSDYLDQAREEAMADARNKAEQLADLAGVSLGSPTFVTESSETPVLYPVRMASAPMEQAAGGASVNPGETTIVATVQIIYEIF
jgi:uncharacterized protein YggE